MFKKLVLVSFILLASCSAEEVQRLREDEKKDALASIKPICLEGVTYWFGVHEPFLNRAVGFLAPKLTVEGKVIPCK